MNKKRVKNFLIYLGVVIFLISGIYDMFIKTTDEIGFLGAGKVGRQVLIQTFEYEMKPDVKVDSEFFDRPFPLRLIIGEPLRTTIRFNIQNENKLRADQETALTFLNQPAQTISDRFQGKIVMQDGFEITPDELKSSMQKNNVNTIEDLLAGFGFNKFEIYLLDHPRVEIDIKGTKNVGRVGEN
jgi:hypothetical protein